MDNAKEDAYSLNDTSELRDATIKQSDSLPISFIVGNKSSTVTIKRDDIHRLARAFYNFCIDNKIDAEIKTNEG